MIPFVLISRVGKSIEMENKLVLREMAESGR
jgi:hypothetical protein